MSKRILRVMIFVLGLVVIDRAIGEILWVGFQHVHTGEAGGQINQALRHKDANVIVFGSSLARYQVDPQVIRDSRGWSAFNAGCDGHDIWYARMLQSLLLRKNSHAHTFLLIFNWTDLFQDDRARARMFAAFVDEDPVVAEVLGGVSTWERIKLRSRSYRFNTSALSIVRHLISPHEDGVLGFVAVETPYVSRDYDQAWFVRDIQNQLPDYDRQVFQEKVNAYRDFVRVAADHGIRTVVVIPPTFRQGLQRGPRERMAIDAVVNSVQTAGGICLYIDEESHPEFLNQSYFGDQRHVNALGARRFSELLVQQL